MSTNNKTTHLTEQTPLISSKQNEKSFFPPLQRVFLTSVLLAMTFAFTQTTLIYSFRTMTCDEYYKTHYFAGVGDKCAIKDVEARTASSIALMSTVTTTCTIANLFLTGYWVKRYGVKAAMFQQTFWASLRNLCQIYAQHPSLAGGGALGIRIIQVTQLFNILGSGGGYQLAANSFVASLTDESNRTGMFGVLSGVVMGGAGAGYILGGIVYHYLGPLAPFETTFILLVSSTIFGSLFLPYIQPNQSAKSKSQSFLQPLKTFIPLKKEGERYRNWNLWLLGAGAFFSVLATGYVPMALQLVGINGFGFGPEESGVMQALTLIVKALFLSIIFPRIISYGRHYLTRSRTPEVTSILHPHPDEPTTAPSNTLLPPSQDATPAPTDTPHGSAFDLHFLRWSIFTDGVLTACVAASSQGWHLFLAAGVLPFASGTGAACKGVVLDFVDVDERADALSGIALIEKLAAVLTVGLFGGIFSALSQVGRPTLVFLANAGVAMIGFMFLLFVRMPKTGQVRLE